MNTTFQFIEWYKDNRSSYQDLASQVSTYITGLLDSYSVMYTAVYYRAKDIDSFAKKIYKKKYKNPAEEVKDLAGVRVIVFFEADISRVCELIERRFKIDYENSINKSKALAIDEFGYRSVHYVAKLPDRDLEEYPQYKDMSFEIQIRTILQHAWAEINHDRNYKLTGILPDHIRRRFQLLSAVLELADKEFDTLAKEVDIYRNNVNEKIAFGNLDLPINSISLKGYLLIKFNKEVERGLIDSFGNEPEVIIQELRDFGVNKIMELDSIIPEDICLKGRDAIIKNTFLGLLRDIMIVSDVKKYFEKSWKGNWKTLTEEVLPLYKSYNVPIDFYIAEHELSLASNEVSY